MAGLILQFVLLVLLIVAAGTVLASTADRIAELTGLGRTLAGFFLLAGATSLPELVIDCHAARLGAADLAVGDLLGSCIFNLLILGVIDLARRTPARIISSVSAAHALSAATSILLTAILLIDIVLNLHTPSSWEWLGVGAGPWTIGLVYLLSVRLVFLDQQVAGLAESSKEPSAAQGGLRLDRNVLGFVAAAITVLIGGPLLARVSDTLANETGLGGTIVGTILVALTTSLPEIITTLAAVRLGASEMAAGNILGSNCFNLAILPFVDACYASGPILHAVELTHAVTACAIIIITGVAVMGLLYRVEKRYWLFEPDALLVVVLAVTALAAVGLLGGSP